MKIARTISALITLCIACLFQGCATHHVTGHLDSFLVGEINRYGGKVGNHDKTSDLYGEWTYERDQFGTAIKSSEIKFPEVDDFLKQMYGTPTEAGETDEHSPQWVIPAKVAGVSIWYSKLGNGVQISVVKAINPP
jgi:hypothetical protein